MIQRTRRLALLRKSIRISREEKQEFERLLEARERAEVAAREADDTLCLASGEFSVFYERMMERHGVAGQMLRSFESEPVEDGFLFEVEPCPF
jgi:hypothetical protein